MEKKSLPILAALSCIVLSSGCDDPDEFAQFSGDVPTGVPECMTDQFPFEPTFLAARTRDNRTGIFLQSAPDVKSRSDVAYFQLYDTRAVETNEMIPLGAPSSDDLQARGKIVFLSSCPGEHDTLELEGTIEFDSFQPEPLGIIDGHYSGSATLARNGKEVIENLSGSWRFVVRQGPPHEDFYAFPDRP